MLYNTNRVISLNKDDLYLCPYVYSYLSELITIEVYTSVYCNYI